MISTVAGVALVILAVGALVFRYVPIPGHLTMVAVIASPFLMLAAPIAIIASWWGRHWGLAAVASGLTIVLIVVQLPSYLSAAPPPASVAVRVMSMNMLYGRADADAVTREAGHNADVLMVQELTSAAARRLATSGLEATFPHQILDPRPGAEGMGVYSRYPLNDAKKVPGFKLALLTAEVAVPGVAGALSVASIHLAAPWPKPIEGWRADLAAFPRLLADLAAQAGDGSVIVAGDFNSTIDMRPFRQLLTNGYRDAAEQAGDGRNLTFPANRRFPAVIGIDHVLTRNATAVSTSTTEIPRSDHRALFATVMVPTN
ncbi:MAG: endonuclease/exonuclease/phosphatase family protein [Mycobacterium sp.]